MTSGKMVSVPVARCFSFLDFPVPELDSDVREF
jgi:hypothetical protein